MRAQLNDVIPDLLVIAEEFANWDDSKRRIDLLALDKRGSPTRISDEPSILWLNSKGLDITAFRMSSYLLGDRHLLDFQQIIPLREAEEYQVRVRNKQQVEQTARKNKGPWNGEYYVSYGGERPWADARTHGFISGGGGAWYSRTLNLLSPGDRVWVKIPDTGFVGVGTVVGAAEPIDDFHVEIDGVAQRFLDVATQPDVYTLLSNDPEKAEYVVRVQWTQTVPEPKAVNEKGLFGNQNTVCRPTTPQWMKTVARLKDALPQWETGNA